MKIGSFISAAALGLCAAGAAALYFWHRRKTVQQSVPIAETPEDVFRSEWTGVLTDHARVFNGLYSSVRRVADGTAQRPDKVMHEWCQRAHYRWENEQVDVLCQQYVLPLTESADRDGLAKWGQLLMDASASAGITTETAKTIVLNENNVEAYLNVEGEELYLEDTIEVLNPAWYQKGRFLEQGRCRKVSTPEE